MSDLKEKKIIKIISIILLVLILLLFGLFILIKNKSIKLDCKKYNKDNISMRFKSSKVYTKKIYVSNRSKENKDVEILFNDVDLNKYSDYIVYQLYDGDNLIHKGIVHDDIDNIIGNIKIDSGEKKKLILSFECVNKNKDKISVDGTFTIRDKKEKNVSYFFIFDEKGNDLNSKIKEMANGRKLSYSEKDTKVKAIKIAKKIDNKYMKEENIVSSKDSSKPIYMWFDTDTIYLYSENTIGIGKNTYSLFKNLTNLSDINDLKYIDTSEATSFSYMFAYDAKLSNIRSLSYWDSTNLTNVGGLFYKCDLLNDISSLAGFDTSKVKDLDYLISESGVSNINALRFFDVSNLKSMIGMLESTDVDDLTPLKDWKTDNLEEMWETFLATNIQNVDALSNWNTSKLKNMFGAFSMCFKLDDISGLANWNTKSLENINMAFDYTSITNVDSLANWNVEKVKNMSYVFSNARKLDNINGLSNWNTKSLENLEGAFKYTAFKDTSPLKKWDTSKVTNMNKTFSHCKITDTSGIDRWNLDKVENFKSVFETTPNRPKWNGTFDKDGNFVKN